MTQRRFHYEGAFEQYLRGHGIPYIAVDEAKRALLGDASGGDAVTPLKSFDFVVYPRRGVNLLVDVKGRKHGGRSRRALQNWVTRDDVESMQRWAALFGGGFEPAFAFLFWCEQQPPDALFMDVFEHTGRWYAVQMVGLSDYAASMRARSASWDTVSVPAATFGRIARPLREMVREAAATYADSSCAGGVCAGGSAGCRPGSASR